MSDSSGNDNPYLQPLTSQSFSPSPAVPISSPVPPAQQPTIIPPFTAQSPSAPTQPVPQMPTPQQAYTPPNVDYSYVNTEPMTTGYTQQSPQYISTPEYASQNTNGYIMTQNATQSFDQHQPVNWLKIGLIAAVVCVILGGTGGALYMIKTTTDSVSKAAKTQADVINEIIKETDTAFTLVQKVEAGYQNPFEPSIQKSNPFADVSNPFDEIGL